MRILLLSAYDAASHRRWRQGMVSAFPEHDWEQLVLPPRYFSWRIRGNSLSWAFTERALLEQSYELIIATSMVDLATLRGLVPTLANTATIVYFHENQFAYPVNEHQQNTLEPAMVNLYSALAADAVVFNSDYNYSSFIAGVSDLLQKLPDFVPTGITELLKQRSQVLPVALEDECFQQERLVSKEPLHILWNHRWEYDKGPERLLRLVELMLEQQQVFSLSVVGESFRQQPAAFAKIQRAFASQSHASLKHFAYIDDVATYRQLLASADVVLSTAVHDFQGLSVIEAVAAGCIPLLPDRLCYPQWFPAAYRYASFIADPEREARDLLERVVTMLHNKKAGKLMPVPEVERFSWGALRPAYQSLLSEVVARTGSLYDSRP